MTTIQTTEARNLASDVLGQEAWKMNSHGGVEWPAVAAVRGACEDGRMRSALDVLVAAVRKHAPRRVSGEGEREFRRLVDTAETLLSAKTPLSARSDLMYLAQGMAVCNRDDAITSGAAAVLEAAMWWAVDLEESDKSICQHHIEKAARAVVVGAHERAYLEDGHGWASNSAAYVSLATHYATAAADFICGTLGHPARGRHLRLVKGRAR